MHKIAIETRTISATLAKVVEYQANQSQSTMMNVQNHHEDALDKVTMAGTQFNLKAVGKALAGAVGLTQSRGAIALFDNGNLSMDGVQRQYKDGRYSFQFNIEYRSNGVHGGITLIGFTETEEQYQGVIPDDMVFCFNSVSIYVMTKNGRGAISPRQVYSGRLHGVKPARPVGKLHDNQFASGLSAKFGTSGFDPVSNNDFGLLTAPKIGAQLGVEHSTMDSHDMRLMAQFEGSSFEANNLPRLATNLLAGFQTSKKTACERITKNYGRFMDDESKLFGDSSNALSMAWALAGNEKDTEANVLSNRLLGYIKQNVPSFENDCRLRWRQIKNLFPDMDQKTEIGTISVHEEMEKVYGLTAETRNSYSGHVESDLVNRVTQIIPSIIATRGFDRFSFMATNRTRGSFGAMKDTCTPLGNVDHPFLNNAPDELRRVMQDVCQDIMDEVCPTISDNGNRHYEVTVHYAFRADMRIIINVGNGPRQHVKAVYPDSYGAAAASFNSKLDMRNLSGSINGLSGCFGQSWGDSPSTGSLGSNSSNKGWGEPDTSNWGDMGPSTGFANKFNTFR